MGRERVAMLGSVVMVMASALGRIGWFAVLIMSSSPAALP
jgi:hypothetical protein